LRDFWKYPSRRFGAYALFDRNDSRRPYVENQKKLYTANQAREHLTTLLGWSNGINTTSSN